MKKLSDSELERGQVILQIRAHRTKLMREKKETVVDYRKKGHRYGK